MLYLLTKVKGINFIRRKNDETFFRQNQVFSSYLQPWQFLALLDYLVPSILVKAQWQGKRKEKDEEFLESFPTWQMPLRTLMTIFRNKKGNSSLRIAPSPPSHTHTQTEIPKHIHTHSKYLIKPSTSSKISKIFGISCL